MPLMQPINHGTTGGAAAHFRRKIPLCDECREARNIYQREMTRARRSLQSKAEPRRRAIEAAKKRLMQNHFEEYKEILDEEMAKVGTFIPR